MRNLSILAVLISCMFVFAEAAPQHYPGDYTSSSGSQSQDGVVASNTPDPNGKGRIVHCNEGYGLCWKILPGELIVYEPDPLTTPEPPENEAPPSPFPTTLTNNDDNGS